MSLRKLLLSPCEKHGALGAEEPEVAFHAPEVCIGAERCLRRADSPGEPQAQVGTTSGMQTEAGWALQGVDFSLLGRTWP